MDERKGRMVINTATFFFPPRTDTVAGKSLLLWTKLLLFSPSRPTLLRVDPRTGTNVHSRRRCAGLIGPQPPTVERVVDRHRGTDVGPRAESTCERCCALRMNTCTAANMPPP